MSTVKPPVLSGRHGHQQVNVLVPLHGASWVMRRALMGTFKQLNDEQEEGRPH